MLAIPRRARAAVLALGFAVVACGRAAVACGRAAVARGPAAVARGLAAVAFGLAVVAFGLADLALGTAAAQTVGRQPIPPPTTEGEFIGTWYRREPGIQQALQVRKAGGRYELRLYVSTEQQFVLDTNWQERVEYVYRGRPGAVELVVDQKASTGDEIVARYMRRQVGSQDADRLEQGDVRLYRFGSGRTLVWLQDTLRSRVVVPEPIAPYQEDGQETVRQRVWIFEKAARRLIQWDEVPW